MTNEELLAEAVRLIEELLDHQQAADVEMRALLRILVDRDVLSEKEFAEASVAARTGAQPRTYAELRHAIRDVRARLRDRL